MLLDIHTHYLPTDTSSVLFSHCMKDVKQPKEATYLSAGIHPWFITKSDLEQQISWLEQQIDDQRTIALGEAGLDKCCQTPLSLQIEAFKAVIHYSEAHRLPLIIHNVKATDELISLKKVIKPKQAWIIHGFRGKKELANCLLKQGFYLSFGKYYNTDALKQTPFDRLLLETDESKMDIMEIYQNVAYQKGTTINELKQLIQQTINFLFFNR